MNTDKAGYCNSLTGRVLSAVFEVSNTLGAGFLALTLRGIRSTSQTSLAVTYKGHPVGRYFAGLLVEDLLIIEMKCVNRLAPGHTAQCLNYLRDSGLRADCAAPIRVNLFQSQPPETYKAFLFFPIPRRISDSSPPPCYSWCVGTHARHHQNRSSPPPRAIRARAARPRPDPQVQQVLSHPQFPGPERTTAKQKYRTNPFLPFNPKKLRLLRSEKRTRFPPRQHSPQPAPFLPAHRQPQTVTLFPSALPRPPRPNSDS